MFVDGSNPTEEAEDMKIKKNKWQSGLSLKIPEIK